MNKRIMAAITVVCSAVLFSEGEGLEQGFANPPLQARTRAYWQWHNGNVDKAAITKDLEWMKKIGMGGGLVFDVGAPAGPTPLGPVFNSPAWRELFVHAVREADRLGLELSLSPQSGWNLGGPPVKPEQTVKHVTWSETRLTGPVNYTGKLPAPPQRCGYYRDARVIAYRVKPQKMGKASEPVEGLERKAMYHEGADSTINDRLPFTAGDEDALAGDVLDLTSHLEPDGTLRWEVPAGTWEVFRFGGTVSGSHRYVSTPSGQGPSEYTVQTNTWSGFVVDYLDADAIREYWRQVVAPLMEEIRPYLGKAFRGFETDSWEAGGLNWTARMPEEFLRRRGYDLTPYLPVFAGRIIGSRDASNRFLYDLRKTVGELMAENHYGVMAELAQRQGLIIHCEAGGPHLGPLDALKNWGRCTWPMGEFWVPSPHRPSEDARYFMKGPASAAHIYGQTVVCGEGFTSIGPHWNDTLWSSLKPTFDHEACAGLNLTYIHNFACSPAAMGVPGQVFFAGTHFNPQITWANMAQGFIGYMNRCQYLLQQGQFVADVCYYYGDHVPNVPGRKQSDPARVLPGYDYDFLNEEMLLQLSVKEGRLVLPGGMSYRLLALPNLPIASLAALQKVRELTRAGAKVVGPRPQRNPSLTGYPSADQDFRKLCEELWAQGKVANKPAKTLLAEMGVKPDCEVTGEPSVDFIHRRDGSAEIYFLSNPKPQPVQFMALFRVSGKQPELWDAVTGTKRDLPQFECKDARTAVPLELEAYGSAFVVFRVQTTDHRSQITDAGSQELTPPRETTGSEGLGGRSSATPRNFPALKPLMEVSGAWSVRFDPRWGGPSNAVTFEALTDWTSNTVEGIKYYSGTAMYRKVFDLPTEFSLRNSESRNGGTKNPEPRTLNSAFLSLGEVKEMATVRLNGKDLGVVWCPPWRVEITGLLKPAGNVLEIDVVNNWPNRLIGDGLLPAGKRWTKTNYAGWYKPGKDGQPKPLFGSGLLGPVTIQQAVRREVIPAPISGKAVPPEVLEKVYQEVRTPYKYGVVIHQDNGNPVDCPCVFRHGNKWYMIYVCMNQVGYETHLAESEDLLSWKPRGQIMRFRKEGWDAWQADGGVALCDPTWGGSSALEQYDGKYWLSYFGGYRKGYETDPLAIGMAWTQEPAEAREWTRIVENPVLSPVQSDARTFEQSTLFKSQVIRDKAETLGYPFVMFYNARTVHHYERIGMAVSADLKTWRRYGNEAVIDNRGGISGDPQIVRMGDLWVMFYFGAFWKPKPFDTFACSYDLVHWTQWTGSNLMEGSEPWDKDAAHKPWLVKHNGVVYHYYCAVGNQGRVIALATSRDMAAGSQGGARRTGTSWKQPSGSQQDQ